METTSSLDKLIRVVPRRYDPQPDEVLVQIDLDTFQPVEDKRRIWLRGNMRQYAVSKSQQKYSGQSRAIPIQALDRHRSREIAVYLQFLISSPSGGERLLVQSLSTKKCPHEAFLDLLEESVLAYVNGHEAEFLDDFEAHSRSMIHEVQRDVSKRTGLHIALRLKLKYEDLLTPIEISKKTIQVRPRGVDEPYAVTFSTAIIANPEERVKAVIAYQHRHTLSDRVTEALKTYFAGDVHFNDFFLGLPEDLRRRLRDHIDGELSYDGHCLDHLAVEPLVHGPKIERFLSLENIEVERTTPEGRGVRIRNDLQLTLVDAARFRAAQISDIRIWIKKELNETIEKRFFGMRYVDFLLRFEPIKEAVVEELSQRVESIGYKLDQLISHPDMPEERWFEPRPRVFTYDDGLPTRDAKITVNLQIEVGFELPRQGPQTGIPSPIEPLLNKNVDIHLAIKESLRAEVEMIMHEQAPDKVYMRFSVPGEGNPTGVNKSLEEQLRDCAEAHLVKRYAAILHSRPVIKPLDSEIGVFVNDLINRRDDIDLEFEALSSPETFRFRGRIRIDSPVKDGWYLIVKRNFGFADIKKQCIDSLIAELKTYDPQMLGFTVPEQRQELEQKAAAIVRLSVAKHYGLSVCLSDFQRDRTTTERALSEAKVANTLAQVDKVGEYLTLDASRRLYSAELARAQLDARSKLLDALNAKELELLGAADDDENRDRIEQVRDERSQILGEGVNASPETVEELLAIAEIQVRPRHSLSSHEDSRSLTSTSNRADSSRFIDASDQANQEDKNGDVSH